MGPQEFFIFDQPRDNRSHTPEPEPTPTPEPEKVTVESVARAEGLGVEPLARALASLRLERKEHPLHSDKKIIKKVHDSEGLRGNAWKRALQKLIDIGKIPPAKELLSNTKTTKIKKKSSLSRLGGNSHLDDIARNND